MDRVTTAPGAPDLYPEALRDEIDELAELIYTDVNNGVYSAASPAPRRRTNVRTTGSSPGSTG